MASVMRPIDDVEAGPVFDRGRVLVTLTERSPKGIRDSRQAFVGHFEIRPRDALKLAAEIIETVARIDHPEEEDR